MEYHPDEWCLVRIGGTHPHYRIFASWRGGYLDGDSWRLNSGITRVEQDDNYFLFYGSTGSCYKCHRKSYGINSPYNWRVLRDYVEKSQGTLQVFDHMPEIETIDWDNAE